MPEVDRVADGLADEVGAEGLTAKTMALETLAQRAHVALVAERLVDLEVVAPAGKLEAVEAPVGRLRRERLERQVGPLTREQRDRPRRGRSGLRVTHSIPLGARGRLWRLDGVAEGSTSPEPLGDCVSGSDTQRGYNAPVELPRRRNADTYIVLGR